MSECTIDIEQTLFLGCSIESFSCNLGFNEQPTEVNVRLVRDTCPAPEGKYKVYYDIYDRPIKKQWTDPDPGFYCYGPNQDQPPQLGAPVYFRCGDFEFSGLLHSWVKNNTKTSVDVYDVKLVSPVEILEGCQLILSDYTGPVKGFNVFNVYGFHEVFSKDSIAPAYIDPRYPIDGPIMGSFSGAFGGANVNSIGMPWYKIKFGIQILTSSIIPITFSYKDFSEWGRIVFYGAQSNARFGLLPPDDVNISLGVAFGLSTNLSYYLIDISELPEVPDYYRIPGPNISLLSLISQVCSDFGLDFYIELIPVTIAEQLYKFIKIRTISRNYIPNTNVIQSFINATSQVVDSSFGRELRNESTSVFLIGGQKQTIWQVTNGIPDPSQDPEEKWLKSKYGNEQYVRDKIVPFFGKDREGNAYVLNTTSGVHIVNGKKISEVINDPNVHYINFDFRGRYNWPILDSILPEKVPVTIAEMRCAAQGYDTWSFHSKIANTVFNQYVTDAGLDIQTIFNPNVFQNNQIIARDIMSLYSRNEIDQFEYELRQYVALLADIYEQSRRTFMIRVPWIKAKYFIDSNTIADSWADLGIIYTDEPTEGGWTEADYVAMLPNPSVYLDRMRLSNGTIRPFGMFDLIDVSGILQTSKTISEFNSEQSFAIDRQLVAGLEEPGKLIYYSCDQQSELIFLDRKNLISPRVIVQFNQPLDIGDEDSNNSFFGGNGWNLHAKFISNPELLDKIKDKALNDAEKEHLINYVAPSIREPDQIVVALKSNVHTYGPWKPNNIIEGGPPGQTQILKQEDLVPWNYGSYQNLNNIAQIRANNAVSIMNEGETGHVTVYGLPDVPLGAEIAALRGLATKFYNNNEHLIENRNFDFIGISLINTEGQNINFQVPFVNLGSWNGSFGPTLTSLNVEVSNNNVVTTYGFRTFTPKFGVMSKLNAERLEQRYIFENQRRANIRLVQEAQRIQNKLVTSLNKTIGQLNINQGDVRAQAGSPHAILVGQIISWNSGVAVNDDLFRRTIVSTKSLYELQNNISKYTPSGSQYDNLALMSLDGLVRPVSITGGGELPRFYNPILINQTWTKTTGDLNNVSPFFINNTSGRPGNTSFSISPFYIVGTGIGTPIINSQSPYNYIRNIHYFNPLSNPTGIGLHPHAGFKKLDPANVGHDIDIVGRYKHIDFTGSGSNIIVPIGSGYNSSLRGNYADDYRFLALRGPLIVHGWGYDTNGKPIPNEFDNEAKIRESGIFVYDKLSDKFLPGFLRKPHTWPVAPVDLRFDRDRGVWVCPPPYPILQSKLLQTSGNGLYYSGLVNFNNTLVFNESGNRIYSGIVPIKIGLGSYKPGDSVQVQYSSIDGYYHIIGGGGGSPSIKIGRSAINIPGRTGAKLGSGIVNLKTLYDTGSGVEIIEPIPDKSEIWYNLASGKVNVDKYLVGVEVEGKTIVVFEEC